MSHLRRLESARDALGSRARDAKVLLFGTRIHQMLYDTAAGRPDVEIIDL